MRLSGRGRPDRHTKAPRHRIRPCRGAFRRFLRNHYWGLALTAQLQADHKKVASAAQELPKLYPEGWAEFHCSARFLADCVGLAGKDEELSPAQRGEFSQAYASEAIAMLREAVTQGYHDAKKLQSDKVFSSLSEHQGFVELLSELEPPVP